MSTASPDVDRVAALEQRTLVLEDFKKKFDWTAGAVYAAWAALGLSVVTALTILGGFIWSYSGLTKDVGFAVKELDKHEGHYKDLRAKFEAEARELREKHAAILKAHQSLRSSVIVLYDRQGKGVPNVPEAVVFRGRILDVSPEQITILPPELGQPALRFKLRAGVDVRIGPAAAKLDELRPGLDAEVLCVGGEVKSVSVGEAP